MSKSLDKLAKEEIMRQMEDIGELTMEAVMDLIRVHFVFDPLLAKEREIRRNAHRVMAQFKDENGVRNCYNFKDNCESKYVNVGTTRNIDALKSAGAQLRNQYMGLRKGRKKINARLLELAGQTKLFGEDEAL